MIEEALLKYIENLDIKAQVKKDKYKIKFTLITKD